MAGIVRSSHSGVKRVCAVVATALALTACDIQTMRRPHPIRPYLLAWRHLRGLSQEIVAERLGIHYATLGRYERGELGVNDETFAEIAEAYGVSVAELSAHPQHQERAKALGRVLEAVKALDEEGLAALAVLAERLKR